MSSTNVEFISIAFLGYSLSSGGDTHAHKRTEHYWKGNALIFKMITGGQHSILDLAKVVIVGTKQSDDMQLKASVWLALQ